MGGVGPGPHQAAEGLQRHRVRAIHPRMHLPCAWGVGRGPPLLRMLGVGGVLMLCAPAGLAVLSCF